MADVLNGGPARPATDQSTSELVQRATEQISTLVRDEIALAKAELAEKGKHIGIGVGLFSGGGVLALYGVGVLIATLVLVLNIWLWAWLSALIVTVALFLVAGILALLGKSQVSKASPPEPSEAVAGIKADVDEVKHAVRDRGRTTI
jgi:uncharacterized membrane protein YqjE